MVELLRRNKSDFLIGGALCITSLMVYKSTLTPSLSYKSPDGNELATIPYILGLAHSTGYPLYTWLGKLFTYLPVGDVAHRMNLMSAVLGAAGVGLLYAVVLILIAQARVGWSERLTAGFTALFFAFSRTFWSQTGIAEVYAVNLFMVVLVVCVLLIWAQIEERDREARPADQPPWRGMLPSWRSLAWLGLAALLVGLSLGTHMSNLGFGPAILLFVCLVSWRTAFSPAAWPVGVGGFMVGVLQFLWLPFKVATLNDRLMLRNAPSTLRGIYDYTLGAFPQFKFAFGLAEIPDRIVIYLAFLFQQFGLVGIALGFLGMWVLLFRMPKRFFLLMGMYLVHVIFFTQYAVYDLDVFFIPAHLLFAICIGMGVWQTLEWMKTAGRWLMEKIALDGQIKQAVRVGFVCLAVLVLSLGVVRQVRANWKINDYSEDTAINDFYENVFTLLPADSVLVGRSGVFGYDMFYYRLVYDLRPDVLMPHLATPDPDKSALAGRMVFTNERVTTNNGRTAWSIPENLLPAGAWSIPILLGPSSEQHGMGSCRADLIMWQISETPPQLVLPVKDANPQNSVDVDLPGKTLVGYDMEETEVDAGRAVHLTLYWKIERLDNLRVDLGLDGEHLLSYEIGFGNLQRTIQERITGPIDDREWVIVDDFWLVIPRTTSLGTVWLSVGNPTAANLTGMEAVSNNLYDFATIRVNEAAPFFFW
ncbi:MAG: DUF2723 domain-containing protein [Anaerolineales bacterium]|nr:DUF2723 domain-containing protein [Anaerolineales bacterium]